MSLEKCKRLAEEKLEKYKEIRRSMGMVDDEDVKICFSINPLTWHSKITSKHWVVAVWAYGELSTKYFKKKEKDSAERYFEKLTREYGLQEEEK